jgi:hypothetical protein
VTNGEQLEKKYVYRNYRLRTIEKARSKEKQRIEASFTNLLRRSLRMEADEDLDPLLLSILI